MGTVWHARHPEGVDVAVKVLRPEFAAEAELLETFRREVRSVASLDHPNIVRVYDYGAVPASVAAASGDQIAESSPWLAMAFAGGGTLGERGPVGSWDELSTIVRQILDGLAHSHARGIVHRDLKPRNVLLHLTEYGAPPRIAVTDFGIAHALARGTDEHAQAGTPGYMAPEQIRGDWRDQGPWTDLYAVGCVAWRLCTGRAVFGGDTKGAVLRSQLSGRPNPLEAVFQIPADLEPWLRRLVAADPADRFQTAADAAHAFAALGRAERRRDRRANPS
ncbi:MAG: serine/threonine-protein kinase, partial [Myxococcota bacterium]